MSSWRYATLTVAAYHRTMLMGVPASVVFDPELKPAIWSEPCSELLSDHVFLIADAPDSVPYPESVSDSVPVSGSVPGSGSGFDSDSEPDLCFVP